MENRSKRHRDIISTQGCAKNNLGPAECAERLNPPPPSGGAGRDKTDLRILSNSEWTGTPRIPPGWSTPNRLFLSRGPRSIEKPLKASFRRLQKPTRTQVSFFFDFWWLLKAFMSSKCPQNRSKMQHNSIKIGCHFPSHSFHCFSTEFSWIRRPAKPRKSLIFIANNSKIACPTFWFPCRFLGWFSINCLSIVASKM